MKLLNLVFVMVMIYGCEVKTQVEVKSDSGEEEALFDSLLAVETGADPYGMRTYVLAYLKAGPNRNQDSVEAVRLQRAHLDNISRLAEQGKLVIAGPFLDDGEIRGIYIFAVETIEEAEKLTRTDPAIQAGRLIMDLRPWYGSAAIMRINEIHKTLSKEQI